MNDSLMSDNDSLMRHNESLMGDNDSLMSDDDELMSDPDLSVCVCEATKREAKMKALQEMLKSLVNKPAVVPLIIRLQRYFRRVNLARKADKRSMRRRTRDERRALGSHSRVGFAPRTWTRTFSAHGEKLPDPSVASTELADAAAHARRRSG